MLSSKGPHEILALDNQDTQIITVGPIERVCEVKVVVGSK